MRKSLSAYQIELLDFVANEKKNGITFLVAFSKFASLKKSSESKVFSDWYNSKNGIVRRTYNYEQGNVEKSIPVRRNINNSYTKNQIDRAIELKKTHTYKEVEDITGVKKNTVIYHTNKRKSENSSPLPTAVRKKNSVKASELLGTIEGVKDYINKLMENVHNDLSKQIKMSSQLLKGEINGMTNALKLHQSESAKHTQYIVDRDSSVKYIGEVTEDNGNTNVDKLLTLIDSLEEKLQSKEEVLEDRRLESKRLLTSNEILKKSEDDLLKQVDNKDKEINDLKDVLLKYGDSIKLLESEKEYLKEENDSLKNRSVFQRLLNKEALAIN
jgi:uncharacterized protein (DUF779 family)